MALQSMTNTVRTVDWVEIDQMTTTTDDSHNLVTVWPHRDGSISLWSNEAGDHIGQAFDPENARQMLNG